uniref:NADH-ubiquinone oxidoreductase chain 3 n=1 Tax=Curculionoidea sp. 11 KM-2017 TaxID=2219394 RepID=A0A346RJZ1_9CUCU|nr:NADH dehydrogenase subunit 3 [Curculionoidea sp. 11 KM-2017]
MLMIILLSMIIMLIILILITLLNLISKKSFQDREKMSPFECGFDPKNTARMPFSLQFFLISIIFIIFDVELTLLLPFIIIMKISNIINISIIFFSFISILILGTLHEWKQGAFNWKI